MNIKKYLSILSLITIALVLNGCANSKYNKPFKHNTPLIKDDIRKTGQSEIAKTLIDMEGGDKLAVVAPRDHAKSTFINLTPSITTNLILPVAQVSLSS